ncbi:MAG: hypothetical protein EOM85_03285 [Candidatus Moranbacteria bacterium]|nr:hypothetical protein [Candidatus Moranbacteria bacterium]
MRESNYTEDIRIDETVLDIEWLEQPTQMFKYAKLTAEAKQALDKAKDKVEYVRAELDSKIRRDPKEYNMEKVTEGAVMNTIILQEEFIEAQQAYLDAKFNFDIVRGASEAISARKDALENMVKLYGMQYFAGPRVPHDITDMRKRKAEVNETKAANKIAGKLKKKERE